MSESRGRVSPPGLGHTCDGGCGGSRRVCRRWKACSLGSGEQALSHTGLHLLVGSFPPLAAPPMPLVPYLAPGYADLLLRRVVSATRLLSGPPAPRLKCQLFINTCPRR